MRSFTALVLACLFYGVVGCRNQPTCDEGYTITSASKLGCRASSDQGCAMCCVQQASTCEIRSSSTSGSSGTQVASYDTVQFKPSCPTGCPSCAPCSLLAEQQLCQILAMPVMNCDCTKVNIGNDPCLIPDSCECYCLRYKGLTNFCPAQ